MKGREMVQDVKVTRLIRQILQLVGFAAIAGVFSGSVFAQSTPLLSGYRTFNFGGKVVQEPTAEKNQSKLWWNDGYWWGSLWNKGEEQYQIYRFNLETQSWTSTGIAIDTRPATKGDVLWEGNKLYIVSHIYDLNSHNTNADSSARLYRYSYNANAKTYSLDFGFPVAVNSSTSETLVLDKDSTGKLWITWAQDSLVWVNRSTVSDQVWGTPFVLPVQGNKMRLDDISTLAAFGGNKIGVMWSNQKDDHVYFTVHIDGDPDTHWQTRETVLDDNKYGKVVDDHLSLKQGVPGSGEVYAVMKTDLDLGVDSDTRPGVLLFKRDSNGNWSDSEVSKVRDGYTRPILIVDRANKQLHVVAASKSVPGRKIMRLKSANLGDLNFPAGVGVSFIESVEDNEINDATSTKQNVDFLSGMLVQAADKTIDTYFHNYLDLTAGKPVIMSFNPTFGRAGTRVTLTGLNFNGVTEVVFDGVAAADFSVISDSEIEAQVPEGAASGKIKVQNSQGFRLSAEDFLVGPSLSAIPDQVMGEGEILDLLVSANEPDGDAVHFMASGLPGFAGFSDNGNGTGNLTFSPGYSDDGIYPNIRVIVAQDNDPLLADTVVFNLTVANTNRVPALTVIPNQIVDENALLNVGISATDPDGNSVVLQAFNFPPFAKFIDNGGGIGTLTFTPGFDDGGTYPGIRVIARDNGTPSLADTVFFDLVVNNINRRPDITPIANVQMNEGDTLALQLSASDPDADPLTFSTASLPLFGSLTDHGDGTGVLRLAPGFATSGSYPAIQVIVSDASDPQLSDTASFSLTVGEVNRAPLAVDDIDTTDEDTPKQINVLANDLDPDGDSFFILELIADNTHGTVTLDNNLIDYVPGTDSTRTEEFRYVLQDSRGGLDTATVQVVINPVNDPPRFVGLPDTVTFAPGASATIEVWEAVEDLETADQELTYTFEALPDTLNLDYLANSGQLEITARNTSAPVTAQLVIMVSDPEHESVSDTVTVLVNQTVGIEGEPDAAVALEYELQQNYPNPFNPTTQIRFGLPQAGRVKIEVYNTLGQRVAVILEENKPAGYHSVEFDGRFLSSGIYLYRIEANGFQAVKKMILLK